MEKIDSIGKPFSISKLGNRKGFSLVEMAIVLVIIGIIIGAIVKGQDLMLNSRAKKVAASVTTWRSLALAYLDRNGRYPGDQSKNGIIGDQAGAAGPPDTQEQVNVAHTATGEIATTMENAPDNPIIVGSSSFWVYFGNTTTTNNGVRNAMLICGSVDCATAFTSDQIEIIKTIDTGIDGGADGGAGQFRAVTGAPTFTVTPAVVGTTGRFATFFDSAAAPVTAVVNTTASSNAPWTAGTNVAAIWLFDKPY